MPVLPKMDIDSKIFLSGNSSASQEYALTVLETLNKHLTSDY
jgi:hypothetical protein